ncbi:MAG: DUF6268 family outer membrane beta-barrel protein [Planctomycetota bacterium]
MRLHRTVLLGFALTFAALCRSIVLADDYFLGPSRFEQDSLKPVAIPHHPELLQSFMAMPRDSATRVEEPDNARRLHPNEKPNESMLLISRPQSSTESLNRPLTSRAEELFENDPPGVNSICGSEESVVSEGCDEPIRRFRKSFFQSANTSLGYVFDDSATGFAITTLEGSATCAMPIGGDMNNLLSFTPYIRNDHLQSIASLDLPDDLYDTGVKMFWRKVLDERWSSMVLFTPSYRSDFESSDGAFRIFGMGLLVWQYVPEKLSFSGGVVHTGRVDFPVLPALGLLWTPKPEWKFDLQFPSPRIARRIQKDGQNFETWLYLNGIFGGNTWAVQRPSGAQDELTVRDLRLVFGVEHLLPENRGVFAETGYVFNRSVEYERVPFQADLDSTFVIRGGISF